MRPQGSVTGRSSGHRHRRPADVALALEALGWLALARLAVLALPFRCCLWLVNLDPDGRPWPPEPRRHDRLVRLGWAVEAAATRTPWRSACLAQALAAAAMLRVRGLPAELHLGVTPAAERDLGAHAWLCCDGVTLTGGHEQARYATLSTMRTTSIRRLGPPRRSDHRFPDPAP